MNMSDETIKSIMDNTDNPFVSEMARELLERRKYSRELLHQLRNSKEEILSKREPTQLEFQDAIL